MLTNSLTSSIISEKPVLANCCASEAIVELRNPYLIPHSSATALASVSCVESPSSVMLKSGMDVGICLGMTVGTAFHGSGIDDRLLDRDRPGLLCGTNGKAKFTAEPDMTVSRGVLIRYSDKR